MSLKYEPSSEPLHLQILDNGGVKCWGSNAKQQLGFLPKP